MDAGETHAAREPVPPWYLGWRSIGPRAKTIQEPGQFLFDLSIHIWASCIYPWNKDRLNIVSSHVLAFEAEYIPEGSLLTYPVVFAAVARRGCDVDCDPKENAHT